MTKADRISFQKGLLALLKIHRAQGHADRDMARELVYAASMLSAQSADPAVLARIAVPALAALGVGRPAAPACSVILACNGERVMESDVEFLDISEDAAGADLLRFRCPQCGADHHSNRYG